MREHKFRIVYQHQETGRWAFRYIELGEVILSLGDGWDMVECDEYIGYDDVVDREVYERDIVQMGKYRSAVTWDGCFGMWTVYLDNEHSPISGRVKIIGNMYEHPQLLIN